MCCTLTVVLHHCRPSAPRQRDFVLHKLRPLLANSTVEGSHAASRDVFLRELWEHRFCLIVRGDDMQTSRFLDGIAFGCIPVLLTDGWHTVVAPFADRINYRFVLVAFGRDVCVRC